MRYKMVDEHHTTNDRPSHSQCINPSSPHDALKHHFTSLKTALIVQSLRFLERKFHETGLPKHGNFLLFLNRIKSSSCNSRLVVDEDDNGKFRSERVKKAIHKLNLKKT